jgi:cytochrome d ubiquinol oxidase subunit II
LPGSGLDLTQGAALGLVCVSGVAGLATLGLCWGSRFGLARLTAALAVAAVVIGWAAAQAPRFLPGMTVTQAAADESTIVALIIAVACGLVVLVPSLALLYTLFLRGRLDTPEAHAAGEAPVAPAGETHPANTTSTTSAASAPRAAAGRWGTAAVAGLVAGAGLLVFTDAPWTHVLGVLGLLLCAVSVFALSAAPLDR